MFPATEKKLGDARLEELAAEMQAAAGEPPTPARSRSRSKAREAGAGASAHALMRIGAARRGHSSRVR